MLLRILLCLLVVLGHAQAQTPFPPYQRVQTLKVSQDAYNDVFAVQGDRCYVASLQRCAAIDLKTLQVLWDVAASEDESIGHIAVDRGVVYVLTEAWCGEKKSQLVALNADTGAQMWKIDREGSWSEIVFEDQHAYFLRKLGVLSCLDLTTRRVLWNANLPGEVPGIDRGKLCLVGSAVVVNYGHHTTSVDQTDGRILWQEPDSYLAEGSLVGSKGVVWVPTKDGSVAREATSGKIIWTSKAKPRDFGAVLNGLLVGLDDSMVTCIEPTTGRVLWQRKFPYDGTSGVRRANLLGNHIFYNPADHTTTLLNESGQTLWASTKEKAIPLPCWSNGRNLVCFDRNRLVRYQHGDEPALPQGTLERRALATELTSHFDDLDSAGLKRLELLGQDAFEPVLNAYLATCDGMDDRDNRSPSDGLSGKCTQLFDILKVIARRENSPALMNLISQLPPTPSEKRRLLAILAEVGEAAVITPFFISELERNRDAEEPLPYEFNALEYVEKSSDPSAVRFMLAQLADRKSHLRYAAYLNLARTGGEEGLRAVLAERNARKLLAPLADRVTGGLLNADGYVTESQLLQEETDARGRTWGLFGSGILGNTADLWLLEKIEGRWTNPLFGGVDSPEHNRSGPVAIQALVSDARIIKDSDGDGLTDLAEQRLGTNPIQEDTDGDGDRDDVDPWPNATNRGNLSDAEQVLAAAFEARYHFTDNQGAAVVFGLPDMTPFEMLGAHGTHIWSPGRDRAHPKPLEACYPKGVALISFAAFDRDKSKRWEDRLIRWNSSKSEAEVEIVTSFGRLNATGYHVVVRKIGNVWAVVSMTMSWVA